jgi:hypothetical protein
MTKNTLHIIGGEKGGIGKTTFGIALVEFYRYAELTYEVIDVDRSNPVVGLTYAPQTHGLKADSYDRANQLPSELGNDRILFSNKGEEFYIADRIYESVLKQDVILVLPSQIHSLVCDWLNVNGWQSWEEVEIVHWFLHDGSAESSQLLARSVADLAGMKHVLVKNQNFRTKDFWDNFTSETAVSSSISLPQLQLPAEELTMLRQQYVPLSEANDKVRVLSKNRLKKYLDAAFEQIGSIEIDKVKLFDKQKPKTKAQPKGEAKVGEAVPA